MELVENYENLVKSMVPMECMEPVISGVWDTTLMINSAMDRMRDCLQAKHSVHERSERT